MPDSPQDSSFWKTSRRAVITTLIAITLNPISITFGYFLGQRLQSPRLRIEYIAVELETSPFVVDESALRPIRQNIVLIRYLNSKLPFDCEDWVSDGFITETCIEPSSKAVGEIIDQEGFSVAMIDENVRALERWDGTSELLLQPVMLPHVDESLQVIARRSKETAIEILKSYLLSSKARMDEIKQLQAALQKLADIGPMDRTGKVSFRVGVLNSGDSDGVVFPRATLEFAGTEVALHKGEDRTYTVIRSHSFRELNLVINEGESKKDSLEKWVGLVMNHQQESFDVVLGGSSERLRASGRLSP